MRVLLLVQGVNEDTYLFKNLKSSSYDIDQYDKVIEVTTEKTLDKSWVSKIPFLGDKYGDILQFFVSDEARRNLKTKLKKTALKYPDAEIDLLAHSLGTLICFITPITVKNFICLASPVAMSLWLGKKVRNFIRGRLKLKVENNLYFVYSPFDLICQSLNKNVAKLLRSFNVTEVKSTSLHGAKKYLNDFAKTKSMGNA